MSSTIDVDSESEDAPRKVLDILGDFTLLDVTTEDGDPVVFKLHDYNPAVKDQRTGKMIPLGKHALMAVRPIPPPEAVLHSRKLMGNNWHGVWTGTTFQPPKDTSGGPLTPADVFAPRNINSTTPGAQLERFCLRRRFASSLDLNTMCIYTHGAFVNNGTAKSDDNTTPYAFVFKRGADGKLSHAPELRADNRGAVCPHPNLNNRAELRAILAALTYRTWWGEGWRRVVLVTDSEYVASHATGSLRYWAERGWRTAAGRTVANRDLWEEVSRVMGTYAMAGCEISFWAVEGKGSGVADRVGMAGAANGVGKNALGAANEDSE